MAFAKTKNTTTNFNRVLYWIQLLLSAIIAFLCVWVCFTPMAKIGNVSMGTAMDFVIECFENQYESSQYLNFAFIILAFVCISIAVIRIFIFLVSIKHRISWISKDGILASFVMYAVLIISLLWGAFLVINPLNEYYGCEIISPYILIALFFIDAIFLFVIRLANRLINFKAKGGKTKCFKERILSCVMTTVISILILGTFTLVGLSSHKLIYPDAIKDSKLVNVGTFLVEKTDDYEFGVHVFYFDEGKIKKELVLDSSENEVIGNNYFYYECKIAELEDEMMQMWPEDDDWEKYVEKLAQLEKDIEYLKNNKPKTYTRVELGNLEKRWVETGYLGNKEYQCGREVIGIEYNQNVNFKDENGYKWGNKNNNFLSNLFYQEEIILPVTEFAQDTDFATQEIVVEVHYADGSMKVSKIIPLNYEDLINASIGKNVLKWRDKWGEYQVEITIVE